MRRCRASSGPRLPVEGAGDRAANPPEPRWPPSRVCDGANGLKTFDLSDGDLPRLIDTLPDVRCHDLIVREDLLCVVSEHGLTQYDLTTGRPLELSVIERAPVVYVVDRRVSRRTGMETSSEERHGRVSSVGRRSLK